MSTRRENFDVDSLQDLCLIRAGVPLDDSVRIVQRHKTGCRKKLSMLNIVAAKVLGKLKLGGIQRDETKPADSGDSRRARTII